MWWCHFVASFYGHLPALKKYHEVKIPTYVGSHVAGIGFPSTYLYGKTILGNNETYQ